VLELGVQVTTWRLPGELFEPRPSGPPFTLDDVLDFHLLLKSEQIPDGRNRSDADLS